MKNAFLLIMILSLLFIESCSFFYIVKQGYYQLDMLIHAEPIERVLRSKDLDLGKRKKLELILDVRQFATQTLKLLSGNNYQNINLSWQHLIYTVSASDAFKFKPYLWWFPLIGHVPYKGFFEEPDALREETLLKQKGFDTLKGKISGYSTLGYFSDPVWPAMLSLSDDKLIELIIHELSHRTIYIANQTTFNESLANFIGKTGTRIYLMDRFGKDSKRVQEFDKHQQEQTIYHNFFTHLYQELDKLYSESHELDEKKKIKKQLLENAHNKYLSLPIDDGFKNIDWSYVNNAYLLSFKRYNDNEEIFTEILTVVKGNFGDFFEEIRRVEGFPDPFFELSTRAQSLREKS